MSRIVYTGTFPDGSQLMISRYLVDGGEILEAATRPVADTSVVWGPPIELRCEQPSPWDNEP